MNNLTPIKRKQLICLAIGVICFVVLSWYLAILPLHSRLTFQKEKILQAQENITKAKHNFGMLDRFEKDFKNSQQELKILEDQMASGDVYRWMLHTFEEMQMTNNVILLTIDPPRLGQSELPPQVAYRTALFSISGSAHYHDFGLFLAALENGLPLLRLQKLDLKRASYADTGSEDREQLAFTLELLTLAKPASVQP